MQTRHAPLAIAIAAALALAAEVAGEFGALGTAAEDIEPAALAEVAEALAESLAELGIGPGDKVGVRIRSGSTDLYVAIIGTILNRGYVYKKGTALVPAWLAFSVIRLLEEHFPHLVDYAFTAEMEDVLDEIAAAFGEAPETP